MGCRVFGMFLYMMQRADSHHSRTTHVRGLDSTTTPGEGKLAVNIFDLRRNGNVTYTVVKLSCKLSSTCLHLNPYKFAKLSSPRSSQQPLELQVELRPTGTARNFGSGSFQYSDPSIPCFQFYYKNIDFSGAQEMRRNTASIHDLSQEKFRV